MWDSESHQLKQSLYLDIGNLVPSNKAFIWCFLIYYGCAWIAVNRLIVRVSLTERVVIDYLVGHKALVNDLKGVGSTVWSCSSDQTMRV